MTDTAVIDVFVVAALERVITIISNAVFPVVAIGMNVTKETAAIRAVDQAGESVFGFTVSRHSESPFSLFLRFIPKLLIDDCFMSVRKEKLFIFRGLPSFLATEVFSHRFAQDGVTKIFLAG